MPTGKATGNTTTGEARVRIEGGLAHFPGLAKEHTISFDDIAANDRQELSTLADQANFFHCQPPRNTGRPDGRVYTVGLTIDGKSREIQVTEPIRNPALAKLVSVVRRLTKPQAVTR